MDKKGTAVITNVSLGSFEVNETQRINFPEGIFGFEGIRHYYIIDSNMAPFMLFQAENDPAIGFIVCDPFLFFPDYEFELSDAAKDLLGLSNADEALIMIIVTLSNKIEDVTGNLVGPLVINIKNHKGIQYIINSPAYHTKHPIFGHEGKKE